MYSYFRFSCGINIKIGNYNSNNMGNRSRTEIVAMILDAANEEEEKPKQKLCTLLS